MSIDWLNDFHSACGGLRYAALELRGLANAFAVTGNREMAETLREVSKLVSDCEKQGSDAVGREIRDRCDASQESFKETVGLVLGHILKPAKGANA